MQDGFFYISFSYAIAAESQIDSKAPVFYNKYRTLGHLMNILLTR